MNFTELGNSVNHGKIQKWYGYQEFYLSGNRYFISESTYSLLPFEGNVLT